MINKSDSRCAVVRFCYHSYDYRPNWTPLGPITITYGQRIKRRATYLLRTFIHIKLLKFSFGLSAQPRAIEFLWQKVWVHLAEEFFWEISKPLISKDLAFVTIRYDDIYDRHDTKLRSHDLEKSGKKTSKYKSEGNFSHIRKLLLILA